MSRLDDELRKALDASSRPVISRHACLSASRDTRAETTVVATTRNAVEPPKLDGWRSV
jgi:hypothetical protein